MKTRAEARPVAGAGERTTRLIHAYKRKVSPAARGRKFQRKKIYRKDIVHVVVLTGVPSKPTCLPI